MEDILIYNWRGWRTAAFTVVWKGNYKMQKASSIDIKVFSLGLWKMLTTLECFSQHSLLLGSNVLIGRVEFYFYFKLILCQFIDIRVFSLGFWKMLKTLECFSQHSLLLGSKVSIGRVNLYFTSKKKFFVSLALLLLNKHILFCDWKMCIFFSCCCIWCCVPQLGR